MKTFKIALKNSLILAVIFSVVIACETDFTSIDSDIINRETATSFSTTSESYNVITYNDALGPVQTNGLGVNMLGVYNDPNYGETTANFVSQVNSTLFNPIFGNNIEIDSVVLTLPFFSTSIGSNEDGSTNYQLDSIFPRSTSYDPIKLSIYENNYFLRSFDPSEEFNTPQAYFSNKSTSNSEMISDADLESTLIHVENSLAISNQAIELWDNNVEPPTVIQTLAPSLRIKLTDTDYWKAKIFDQTDETVFSNSNNFNNYFRGLYFKAEPIDGKGSLLIFNPAQQAANVTIFYTVDSAVDSERTNASFVLSLGQNRVNFFENNFTNALIEGDAAEGDSRLNLKGGEGSVAVLKLFDGVDENSVDNFENFRNQFVNLNSDNTFESSKRLVNEANLIFYVDQSMVRGEEPNRLYLYDMNNSIPLPDYFQDASDNSLPAISRPNHLGILERENGESTGNVIRYKMKITSHINNLLLNDSTNVKLGLSVSGNVNLEGSLPQRAQITPTGNEANIPASSIISPRGTILHGNKSEDPSKRVFLEIFYTCLNTDSDCEEN